MQIDKGIALPAGRTDVSEYRLTAKAMEDGDSVFFAGATTRDDVAVKRMIQTIIRVGGGARCRVVEGGVRVWRMPRREVDPR